MSAKTDGLTGEVLHCEPSPNGDPRAFLWHCGDCGRVVISETVFVDEFCVLHCGGCKAFDDLFTGETA